MLGRIAWLVLSVCLLAAAAVAQQPGGLQPPAAADGPTSQTHRWEIGIGVRAIAGPCNSVLGTFPVPAEWPEQEVKVVEENISPVVERKSYRQTDGLKQMVFSSPQIAAGGAAECFVTFEVTKHAQLPPKNTDNLVIPKDPPRDIKKCLNPSPLIESTNAKVRSMARELTNEQETAWQQVASIQKGVRDAVKFEDSPKDKNKGVLVALREGKADREDLNATFVAVCRAAKIPARMVWVVDFCYAEFYLEEESQEADAGAANAKPAKDKKAREAVGAWYPCVVQKDWELGVCRDFRPILGKGDNFKVPEERLAQRWVNLHWTAKGAAKPSAEFRLKNMDR